jgi:hypothetical protein
MISPFGLEGDVSLVLSKMAQDQYQRGAFPWSEKD